MENYRCVTSVQEIQQYIGDAAVVAFDYETAPDGLTASKKRQPLIRQKVILSGAAFPPKSIRGSMFLLLIKLEETWMALFFFDFCKTFSQTKISSKLLTILPLNLQYPVNGISSYSRRCMIPFVQHK